MMGKKSAVAFCIETMLSAGVSIIRCYYKNYPSDKCSKCSFKGLCKILDNLPEARIGVGLKSR